MFVERIRNLDCLFDLPLRGLQFASEQHGFGGISQHLASAGEHPEPGILFVCFVNLTICLAGLSHPGLRPPSKPATPRTPMRERVRIDE